MDLLKNAMDDRRAGYPPPRALLRENPAETGKRGGDDEKRARIIEAALSEFANCGYRNANTNRIVREAGVSKGLLFHYFGSKKELYLYLYDYAMRLISEEFFADFDWDEKDIFKRWRAAAMMKLDMMRKYGQLFEFILDAYLRTAEEVKSEIDTSTMSWLASSWTNMTRNADLSLFREDVDAEKAINILYWTIEGYARKRLDPQKKLPYYREHYAALIDELDGYLDLLRRLFCKTES
jgi:AcrR family transcriptional regulator